MEYDQYCVLVAQMQTWDHAYYVLDAPHVSDEVYDANLKKIKAFESKHPAQILSYSPTQRVGTPLDTAFKKYTRPHKMYSLDNVYNREELKAFYTRLEKDLEVKHVELVIEPKIDGVSIECVYEGDQLKIATTRGDGITGEVVTHNVRTIRGVPLKLSSSTGLSSFTLRGEIYIHRDDLVQVNQDRASSELAPFKNPRNAASGSLRLLDPAETAKRHLRIFFYDFLSPDLVFESHDEVFNFFKKYGFPTHATIQKVQGLKAMVFACEGWDRKLKKLPFDVDGLVIKVNRKDFQSKLGFTSKYPKWAMAYKFAAQRVETQLLDVTFQVGRTGVLTPVARLAPVMLAGTEVSNATLHNMDEIKKKDIRIGDFIWIEKAGDIIPQVIEINKKKRLGSERKITLPSLCPACSFRVGKLLEGDASIRCMRGFRCIAQLKGAIEYFCSRKAMHIEHIGPSLIDQLVETKTIKHAGDLFALKLSDLIELDRMAEKSAQRVVDAILDARQQVTLPRLLTALGIPLLGEQGAKLLAKHFGDFEGFVTTPVDNLINELEGIHGMGPKMIDSVIAYLKDPTSQTLLQSLLAHGINPRFRTIEHGAQNDIGTFVITGTLSQARQDIIDKIESHGGRVTKQISQKTNYLVCNNVSTSSKFVFATEHHIKIITEEALEKLLNG